MRGYASLYFFCAVLTFVSPAAPNAAENAAEYRAPVAGAKLGPVAPVQPAPQAQPGQQGNAAAQAAGQPSQAGGLAAAQNQNAPYTGGQNPPSGQPSAPMQPGTAGAPAPWPSGGMMPYSSIGGLPATAPQPDASGMPAAAQAPDTPAAPGYDPGYAPYPPAPYPANPYPAGQYPAAPYPSAPYSGGQGGDAVYGTSQLQGENFNDRGLATQYRDPQTGDIVTSVVPPSPPEQQNYGTIFVAPQIYPDGNNWGGNPYGPMPRPGQPYMQPPVMWQPPPQYVRPADPDRHRHSDRRHDDRRHDDRYDGRYNGTPPPPPPNQGQYPGQYPGQHDFRGGDRYDSRQGPQGNSTYDQRDADRSRDGRERR
ncbi:MAG: hypothetical protein F8N36_15825 [Desulfovibrio sp.]|uniref:hypothetical protein n=1 Tax=Desulfovibrio sp. TaxID=885 RepID=UPI00135EEE24|nr:hypothetical protein [Desulfovibrio sp.]MTJ94311.1 hypothetical protein [Desulfovibrio sp.]